MAIPPNVTDISLTAKEKQLADMLEAEIDAKLLRESPTRSPIGFTIEADRHLYVSERVQLEITRRYKEAGWVDVYWWPFNQHDGQMIDFYRHKPKNSKRRK